MTDGISRQQRRAQEREAAKVAAAPTVIRTRDNEKVMMAYCVGDVDIRFHRCAVDFLVHDANTTGRVVRGGAHFMLQTTNIAAGRNGVVRQFLELPGVDWLWFVDTDQTFEADTLERMLQSAHPVERPIVGTLIYSYDINSPQKTFPTIYDWSDTGPKRWNTAPRKRLVRCGATGTGCVLIHRSVFEKVAACPSDDPNRTYGQTAMPWFKYSEVEIDGKPDVMGEDLTFMARATKAGFPIHVDTGIEVGHVKSLVVDHRMHQQDVPFDQLLSETYVVVPVRDRVDLTKQLLEQLRAQGGYTAIFVYDNGSGPETRKYLESQRIAEVFEAKDLNIHQMWNAGIRESLSRTPKSNIAILNNDLKLGDEFCLGLAKALRAAPSQVVAVAPNYDGRELTDDLTRVQGIAAAKYDGTGGFPGFAFMVRSESFLQGVPYFDEQFEHWFGDNDWLLELDRRGAVYALAKDVTVEHLDGGSQTDKVFASEMEPKKQRDKQRFVTKWNAQVVTAPAPEPELQEVASG